MTGAIAWLGTALPFGSVVLAQTQAGVQMSEKAFKNVQVLKGIPVDEFMGTMGVISAALSYCCGDCHTGAGGDNPKWEDDPPRKVMARKMVTMVNAINKANFGGRQVVTCWTCHRGSPGPAVTAPLDTVYGEPLSFPSDLIARAPATAATPTADQIFDKYITALGGASAVSALKSFTVKGTSSLFGETRSDPFEMTAKAPNNLAVYVHQRGGDLARTYDGSSAWVMLPLTVVNEYPLTPSAREGAKLYAEVTANPAGIKTFFENWKVGNTQTLDGREVNVVQGTSKGIIGTFYFDKQTGLLSRMVSMADSAVGRVPTQIDYSDYRPVAGVKVPYKWTYFWISGREEYVVTDYTPNATVAAGVFAKPIQRAKK